MKLIIPELPGQRGRQQILPFGAQTMADEANQQQAVEAIVNCLIGQERKEI